MPAIILFGKRVIGHNETVSEEELQASGCEYLLIEAIPDIILTCPSDKYVTLVDGTFTLNDIPKPPDPPKDTTQQSIDELKARQALVEQALDEILLGGM
jgi:hypothetical protein